MRGDKQRVGKLEMGKKRGEDYISRGGKIREKEEERWFLTMQVLEIQVVSRGSN